MTPLMRAIEWAATSILLIVLELIFGVVFYVSSIVVALGGAALAWHVTELPFARDWETEIVISLTTSGAIIGGVAWLTLRYTLIQPGLRLVGLAKPKRPATNNSFGLKPAIYVAVALLPGFATELAVDAKLTAG